MPTFEAGCSSQNSLRDFRRRGEQQLEILAVAEGMRQRGGASIGGRFLLGQLKRIRAKSARDR